ncbi:MAG: glycosyltransferase, partial [Actinomycetota bacterium]|nr:glycosyltransferase [Actinomycetota bacterium]
SLDVRIFGVGPLLDELRVLAERLSLGAVVHFEGFAEDVSLIYRNADIFVLSSDYEGFGNVLVEAMAFGIPIVATRAPFGPEGILEGGKYGELVGVGDVDGLVNGILAVWPGKSRAAELARMGPERASLYYPARVVASLVEYLECLRP